MAALVEEEVSEVAAAEVGEVVVVEVVLHLDAAVEEDLEVEIKVVVVLGDGAAVVALEVVETEKRKERMRGRMTGLSSRIWERRRVARRRVARRRAVMEARKRVRSPRRRSTIRCGHHRQLLLLLRDWVCRVVFDGNVQKLLFYAQVLFQIHGKIKCDYIISPRGSQVVVIVL